MILGAWVGNACRKCNPNIPTPLIGISHKGKVTMCGIQQTWVKGMCFGGYILDNPIPNEEGLYEAHCKTCGKTKLLSRKQLQFKLYGKARECLSCSIARKNKIYKLKHGLTTKEQYAQFKDVHIIANIDNRCNNPKNKDYKKYGARGIKVEEPWVINGVVQFEAFHEWYVEAEKKAKEKYPEQYWDKFQVDRIDNNGNYSPSNCRLVPAYINQNNTRRTTYIEDMPAHIWYEKHKTKDSVGYTTFSSRVFSGGVPPIEALSKEKNYHRLSGLMHYYMTHEHPETLTYNLFWSRVHKSGWNVEKAISTPPHHL